MLQPFINNCFSTLISLSFPKNCSRLFFSDPYWYLPISRPIFQIFPFILFFPSTVLSPVSFIIYQLLISTPLYFSSPLTKNLSTFLGSLFSLLQNTFFSYYYELSFSICITSSVKMEVNIITSSFHVSQYVQLIKCH